MNRVLLLSLALMGCADTMLESAPDGPHLDAARVAGGLVLTNTPLVAGQPATFQVTGADPGEKVFFGRANALGSGLCPNKLGGLCLDLAPGSAAILGTAFANGSGVANLSLTLPGQLAGRTLVVQGVVIRGVDGVDSQKSNPIVEVIGTAQADLGDLGPGDLIVSEVMQNPAAVDDSVGEWFEVYNATFSAVDLQGLVVTDAGVDSFTVTSSVVVGPGGYAVFGRDSNTGINGGVPVDVVFTGTALANGDDEIILSFGGTTFDAVYWDGGATFPDPTGASMSLDPTLLDAGANDAGGAWCEATTVFGAGDRGTPGSANTSCGGVPDDLDGDGYPAPADCDDSDPAVHPNAPEGCDGIDTDCDGYLGPQEVDADGDGTLDCLDVGGDCEASGFADTTAGLTGQALWNELERLTQAQTCNSYEAARDYMFLTLDKVGGQVECVYTGTQVSVGDTLPDNNLMNTEHTWPQSRGADTNPARCDLHHLFPVLSTVNSSRGNNPFGEVVTVVSSFPGGSLLGDDASGRRVFEPRDAHKGNVARAMLYMATRHGFVLDEPGELALYQAWHQLDPVDQDELDRTWDIAAFQVLPNPYVVCDRFVDRL